jgi:type IV secretory pathway VirB3-like protein
MEKSYVGVTRGAQVTGVAVASLSLTWISMGLRFYVRAGLVKFIGREDWLTVAAMVNIPWS